jgi:hypothetical protein
MDHQAHQDHQDFLQRFSAMAVFGALGVLGGYSSVCPQHTATETWTAFSLMVSSINADKPPGA